MISAVINLIQIQHLLKLNSNKCRGSKSNTDIQIQHLLKLNLNAAFKYNSTINIQIQHLLKLNKYGLPFGLDILIFKYNTC